MVPILLALAPLLEDLAQNGLSLLAGAIKAKGKDVIEKQLDVKIPDGPLSSETITLLQQKQMEHEEFLIKMQVEQAKNEIEAEKAAQQQVTDRWKADMMSDSWLSKNVRPLILAYLTLYATAVAPWFKMDAIWVDMIKEAWLVVLGAYFVGRTVQHAVKLHANKKAAK